MEAEALVERFLAFVEVPRGEADLALLNKLIDRFQRKVRWENLTKIIDYETGAARKQFIPPIDVYVDRMVTHGYGGTCWTIAIGFHWLLRQLGYSAHYLYMDTGHLCLRVDLDQPYYVDLGYAAPLFQAYPLHQSFVAADDRETFTYTSSAEGITIVRQPGPTKTLNPEPVQLEDMVPFINRSNDWNTSPMLRELLIFGYIGDIPTSLTNGTLKQHFPDRKIEQELGPDELKYWITDKFGMDFALYDQASDIFRRRRSQLDCALRLTSRE